MADEIMGSFDPRRARHGFSQPRPLIEAVGTYKQDSLTIIRHGKIVADAYYAPYVAGISHDLRSVTKSIVSTLTAIELQQGVLDSTDHPIVDLFPDKHIL